jgi:hypothetical protein
MARRGRATVDPDPKMALNRRLNGRFHQMKFAFE